MTDFGFDPKGAVAHLRKAYATAFRKRKLPTPEALAKAGEKWRPFRTVASWYLWQTLNK